MGDAGVDARRNALLHHLADVEACGRAPEVQLGDGEVLVLGLGDLVHLQRGVQRVLGRTADEGDDGRRGCHGKAANAGRLGDRAVAQVSTGIVGREAGEVEALGGRDRGGEPAVAQAADADAEVGAVAGHGGDNGAALHAVAGVGHGLAGRHHGVQHAEGVVAQEAQYLGRYVWTGGGLRDERRQSRRIQDRAGLVAVVSLVAHVQGFSQQGADVNPPAGLDGVGQDGGHDVLHPAQFRQHLFAVRAVAQHFAIPFVQAREAAIPMSFVLDDVDRHGRRDQAGHRPHRPVVVAGLQIDLSRFHQRTRFSFVSGLSVEDQRAGDGTAHRSRCPLPGDGRAGVQQEIVPHSGNHVPRLAQPHQHRVGFHHTFYGLGVCFFDVH